RLDCAFNNAGVSSGVSAFTDVPAEDWQRVIAINLTGVFWCMQAELRQFVSQGGGGVIVNTSSGAGVVAAPGQPAYTAAKQGVLRRGVVRQRGVDAGRRRAGVPVRGWAA